MAPLTFTFLTDLHYYSPNLGTEGEAYEHENAKNQKLLKNSGKAIASAFNAISNDKTSDIVLINGDLTNNGEYLSHNEIIALLRALKQSGKRIFATTSTHDYQENGGKAYRFEGSEKIETPCAKREELFEMYREFGPDQAFSVHRESMSYAAQLADGYILLALNDDKNGSGKSGYSDSLFDWIKGHIESAHQNGQAVITMTHHPMIAPSEFYAAIGKNDMMGDHEIRLRQFADMDIGFVFTGHSHIHNISYKVYDDQKVIFDISTSALAGYPALYRVVTADAERNTLDIRSVGISDFDDEFNDQLFGMIRRVINAAADDIEDFAYEAEAFSVKKEFTYKYGWLIKPFAKLLRKLKVSTLCKICKKESALSAEELNSLKGLKVTDLVIDMAMNLYKGDGQFTPDTAQYKAVMGFMSVADSFLDTIHKPIGQFIKGAESLSDIMEPLLYKKGFSDSNTVLPFLPEYKDVEKFESANERIKSRKGAAVLAVLIVLALILLPLLPIAAVVLIVCGTVNHIKFHKKIKACKSSG